LLSVSHLNFSYGDLKVLWNIDLEVRPSEIVTMVGANGAGKSTTLKNISRLLKGSSGAIRFEGVNLNRLESHQVVELGVVQVPEARSVGARAPGPPASCRQPSTRSLELRARSEAAALR